MKGVRFLCKKDCLAPELLSEKLPAFLPCVSTYEGRPCARVHPAIKQNVEGLDQFVALYVKQTAFRCEVTYKRALLGLVLLSIFETPTWFALQCYLPAGIS